MKNPSVSFRFVMVVAMLLMAALLRLLPHPPNFSPIGAMALFSAAFFPKPYFTFLISLLVIWLSDLLINNMVYGAWFDGFVFVYKGWYWVYGSFALIFVMGMSLLKKVNLSRVIGASVSASLLFFIVTNFGVWASGLMYTRDLQGLLTCYAAGLPFLRFTLLGDLVYSGLLFGTFAWAQKNIPVLRVRVIG